MIDTNDPDLMRRILLLVRTPSSFLESTAERLVLEDGGIRRELTQRLNLDNSTRATTRHVVPLMSAVVSSSVGGLEVRVNGVVHPVVAGSAALKVEAALCCLALSLEMADARWFADYQDEMAEVLNWLRKTRVAALATAATAKGSPVALPGDLKANRLEHLAQETRTETDPNTGVESTTKTAKAILAGVLLKRPPNSQAVQFILYYSRVETSFVELDTPAGFVTVQHSYTTEHISRRKRLISRLRNGLNLRPFVFRIETPFAINSAAYQLEVVGPTDHFVRFEAWVAEARKASESRAMDIDNQGHPFGPSTTTRDTSSRPRLKVADDGAVDSFNLQPGQGRTRPGHIAFFRAAGPSSTSPGNDRDDRSRSTLYQAFVVFNERPPGTLSRATLFTFLCILTLAVGAYTFKVLVLNPGISAETAIILFSLPATVALLARPRGIGSKAIDPPLIALIGLFVVALMSYLGGIAFLLSDAAAERACASPPPCATVGNLVTKDSSPFNQVDLPFRFPWDPGEAVAIGEFELTGQLALNIILIISGVVWLSLLVRSLFSIHDYSLSQSNALPRELPTSLMSPN